MRQEEFSINQVDFLYNSVTTDNAQALASCT